MQKKTYGRAYFDRWYRSAGRRVGSPSSLARQAALAVAAAEYVLAHPVRNVLDVGCGEARWLGALRRLRPAVRYLGVDPSLYVVARFGRNRRIVSGSFGELAQLNLPGPFDLIVCADVLHYLDDAEIAAGLAALAPLIGGIAHLEVRSSEDDFEGDRAGWVRRPARRYRALFSRAGLSPCGLHLYLGPSVRDTVSALERL